MRHWYVLYTKPNAEYRVEAALRERGIETYLPEISYANNQKKDTKTPFFSCYLFMRVNLETVDYAKWQWLPGLRFIVSYGGLPVTLPETTINLIRAKLNKIEVSGNQPAKDLKPGDNVRITEGPLRDMLAVFDGPTTSSQRVQVLLTILGSVKKVKIDALNLEKTPPGTQVPIPKKPRRTRGRGRYIKGTTQQA